MHKILLFPWPLYIIGYGAVAINLFAAILNAMSGSVWLLLTNCIAGAIATAAVINVHKTSRNYRKLIEDIQRDIDEMDKLVNKHLDD
jgi:hypothetical protein